ncbi:MAG: alpha/beta fold hydrolase [Planctomycetes bacterium]|nr:alpha/beta fold hydrolase [Planctomycetota bacterium]
MALIPALFVAALLCTDPRSTASTVDAAAPAKTKATTSASTVELIADDKRKLTASFWAPKDKRGAVPAAVLVHDAGSSRAELAELGERLWKQGFAVVAVDLRGHGESLGNDKGWNNLPEEERSRAWTLALRDVKAAADWMSEQPGVHGSNLSLLGDRAGATLVARYAQRDDNVRCLVLLEPKAETLGFPLAKDVAALGGLPTCIVACKESSATAQSIADTGAAANDGHKYVEVLVAKGAAVGTAADKTCVVNIAKYMSTQANPQKSPDKQ